MSYGFDGSAGTRSSSAASARSAGSFVGSRGGSSRLFWGRNASSARSPSRQDGSSGNARCATPERTCAAAPPSSSFAHLLVRDGADDVRAGDEHVARRFDHEHEVGDRRRVDRAARARPQHRRQLGHDARRQRVAQEDVGVAGQRHDALLDARAARIVEPDDRRARLHRQVHHLADLPGVRLGQRAAEHGEVLREHEDGAPVDRAVAGDDAVAQHLVLGHAEVGAAVGDQLVHLDEAARVAQQLDALARGQLAGLVLARRRAPRRPRPPPAAPAPPASRSDPRRRCRSSLTLPSVVPHPGSPSRPCT